MSHYHSILPNSLLDLSHQRLLKPRKNGITMVIDKGIGITEYEDLLKVASPYIDYLKLGFGTSLLYPEEILRQKIELAKRFDVKILPGGTMTEIALTQQAIPEYLQFISAIGFDCIEISDGTIDIDPTLRTSLISKGLNMGIEVISEYGKKELGSRIDLEELELRLSTDIEAGASYVIVEGRESGENVGVFNQEGNFEDKAKLDIIKHLSLSNKLIWEAPQKKQQSNLIQLFGTNVNLGNVAPSEVIALEALRRGLRSDTLRSIGELI